MKYLGQVLSALIYTPIYTGIMYFAIVFPVSWVLSLSFWKMIIAFLILGCIIEGLIGGLHILGLFPFAWIVKNNKVAFSISTGLCVIFPILNIIAIWREFIGHGTIGIIASIVITLMLLRFIYGSVISLYGLKVEVND